MHFVTTGLKFPYQYYIGAKSASLFGEVKLWYLLKPNSEYFDKIVKEVESEKINMNDDYPIFKNRYDHWNMVSKFDNLVWKVVSEYGGSVMGLDSITIKPFHDLLGDADMLVGRDAETVVDSYCMHGATCKKDSFLAKKIYEDSQKAMRGEELDGPNKIWRDGYIRFGAAGIIPFLNNIEKYKDQVKINIADFGVLGGYMHDGSPFYLFEKSELLSKDTRTIPFYATWQKYKYSMITPFSIRGTLLGDLVEELKLEG